VYEFIKRIHAGFRFTTSILTSPHPSLPNRIKLVWYSFTGLWKGEWQKMQDNNSKSRRKGEKPVDPSARMWNSPTPSAHEPENSGEAGGGESRGNQ
jgi:hypothetical protein